MHISKNCNIPIEIDEDTKVPVIIPEIKTFPQPMHNLPDDKQLVDQLLDYENKKFENIPWRIEKIFKGMPFKWLSKVSNHFCGNGDVLIVDYPNDLPQLIKKYVQKFYVQHYNSAGFGLYISAEKHSVINENLGFEDFLKYFELTENTFYRWESNYIDICANSVYLFDGIAIENFYPLYFKSGLSKECIFRFLKNDEYVYSIDNQTIEKQVEEILSKH